MLNLFKSDQKEENYFKGFEELALYITKATNILASTFQNEEFLSIDNKLVEIQKNKERAERKKQDMMRYLYQDFLPPIEREDIVQITQALMTIVENVGEALNQIDRYQMKVIQTEMLGLVKLIEVASEKNLVMIKELSQFKKPEKIFHSMQELKDIKTKSDTLHHQAIKRLYIQDENSFTIIQYSKLYNSFKKIMDSFTMLINTIEMMIIRNS